MACKANFAACVKGNYAARDGMCDSWNTLANFIGMNQDVQHHTVLDGVPYVRHN